MIGQTISHYKILEKLGEGGMGIVYKAHDTTLERDVALKFLPAHLSASADDKARFLQEAKAAATLDHPNICTIHSIEEHDDQLFIAMQFVDGHLLRNRMSGLTQKQAIDIGIQVADGLAAAHEKGIVHRDIKPENIMVRKDGIVQIMDFGLAKLKGVSRLTKEGSTVGTAGYMSPEQVQGLDADHRSDIFALGVLLYELMTGQLPFKGVHETAIAYEIVNVDAAPMSSVKPDVDPDLDRIVLECLEKDPAERSQSVKQVSVDLKRFRRESGRQKMSRVFSVPQGGSQQDLPATRHQNAVARAKPWRERVAWGTAAILLAILVLALIRSFTSTVPPKDPIRSSIIIPDSIYIHSYGATLGPPVLSPDGKAIAFSGVTPDGIEMIYVRYLDEMMVHQLSGTVQGSAPFWSPDGKLLGFFQDGRMKRIDLEGGSPITITNVPNNRGGTWSANGTIVFAPDYQSGLFAVSADGQGPVRQITTLDSARHEGSHRWPVFLPDGKHLLCLVRASSETGEAEGDAIFAFSTDGNTKKFIVQSSFNAAYVDGYLLFARGSKLLAQQFDPESLTLEGDPVQILDGLLADLSYNVAVFTISNNGLLLYQTGEALAGARPLFVDMSGRVVRLLDDRNEQDQPRISPDGKYLADYLYDIRSRLSNIWIYDLQSGGRRRLTTRSEGDFNPVWSADEQQIYFSSGSASKRDIFVQSVARTGRGEPFFATPGEDVMNDCSRDGKWALVEATNFTRTAGDLLLVPLDGKGEPVVFQKTRFNEMGGRFSPNNVWIAYTSDESGQDELYLKRVSAPESDGWKISSDGALGPMWGPDGTEIFCVNRANQMTRIRLRFSGSRGEVVSTARLFPMPAFTHSFDLSPDGKIFVITRALEMKKFEPLSLVVDWKGLVR